MVTIRLWHAPETRTRAHLFKRQASETREVALRNGAGVDCPQEVVHQTLAGSGIVEHAAHLSRARCLRDKVSKAFRGCLAAFQEEGVYRGEARRQLRRMEVPALVKASVQGVPHVAVVQLPSALNRPGLDRK